jgi:hypothetical protein
MTSLRSMNGTTEWITAFESGLIREILQRITPKKKLELGCHPAPQDHDA